MAFSDQLLDDAELLWEAQKDHPFARELVATAASTPDSFRHWVEQNYRSLLNYARTFAMRAAVTRSARLEAAFWEIAYTREEWSV